MAKRVFILLEGGKAETTQFKFTKLDTLICADGGVKRILNKKLKSNIIALGDFDSVNKNTIKKHNIKILEFPVDKDITDGELAISYACKNFNKSIKKIIIGGITDRLDHTLGNIQVLIPYTKKGHNFEIYGYRIKVYITSKSIRFKSKISNKISLIALEKVHNARSNGLRWGLNGELIQPYKSRTLRNEAVKDEVSIDFNKGVLGIIETW